MIRKILATADNTRLAKSRKAHGLGLVELWVLKGCQSNQPISQRRSYESRPISGRCSMVSVRRKEPIFRANTAGSGSEKKIHTWARSRSESAQAQRLHHGTYKFQEMLTRRPSMWFCQNPQRETKMFHQARGDKHQS